MRAHRILVAAVIAVPLALGAGTVGATTDNDRDGAGVFIQSLGDRALDVLSDESLSKPNRDRQFRALLTEGFDVRAIAAFCIKQYWRKATPEERAEYINLFTDLIVQTYAARLGAIYSGEEFNVRKIIEDGDNGAMVKSEIVSSDPGNSPIRVDWRVRWPRENYKIVDVLVEGISMAITQRDEFVAVIQRNGGKLRPFLDTLREMIQRLETADAGSSS
jgi:phospholipid transport system substrate-binding protein